MTSFCERFAELSREKTRIQRDTITDYMKQLFVNRIRVLQSFSDDFAVANRFAASWGCVELVIKLFSAQDKIKSFNRIINLAHIIFQ